MAMTPNPTSRAGLAPAEQSSAPVYASFALPPSLMAALQAAPAAQPTVQMQAVAQPMMTPTPPVFDVRAGQQGFADGGMVPPAPQGLPPGAGGSPAPAPTPQAAGTPQQNIMPMQQLQAEIQRFMQQNPQQVQQIQQVIMQALQSGQLSMQDLNMAVQMAVAAAQNPSLYPRLRALAIQRGLADETELPMQYDQSIVFALLVAGAAVQRAAGGGEGVPQPMQPGQVQSMAMGGKISPSASPTGDNTGRADDIPIRVSGGEYVIPKHVVDAKGSEFFDRLLEKYNNE